MKLKRTKSGIEARDQSFDSIEFLSQKFEHLLSCDIRDLDKLISSQIFSAVLQDKLKLK